MKEDIQKRFEAIERRLEQLENSGHSKNDISSAVTNKNLSLKEFLISKNPESYVLKTLTIGYHLEKSEGQLEFNIKDLENAFRNAKEQVPSNINQIVNENIKKGHMMVVKEKKDGLKSWVLTSSGERFVENNFKID